MTKPITIYGIKNCDTMKKARAWLDDHGVAYDFHDYKLAGIAKDKLKQWSDEIGWETLLNRAGTTFKKLPDGDKEGLNERKALALMLAQPSMIKRPVLDLGGKLLVGFKPDIYGKEVRVEVARAQSLVELDRFRRANAAWPSRHESTIDDRPDQNHGLGFRPQAHQVADLEAAFDADALEGADDLLDGVAARRMASAAVHRTRPCRRHPAPSRSNRPAAGADRQAR